MAGSSGASRSMMSMNSVLTVTLPKSAKAQEKVKRIAINAPEGGADSYQARAA
jgi:hypothetical protein